MGTWTVVFVGGPAHGEVRVREDIPKEISLPTWQPPKRGVAVYERREVADTPGRIAYVFVGEREETE